MKFHRSHRLARVRRHLNKKEDVLKLVIITLLPFIPVLAMQVPIGEIYSLVLKVPG